MKLTKNQLQKIIREELNKLQSTTEQVTTSLAQQRRQNRQKSPEAKSFERFKKKVWNLVDDDLWAHRYHQFEADPLLRHFWEISSKDPTAYQDAAAHYNEMDEDGIERQYGDDGDDGSDDLWYDDGGV